MNVPEWVVTQFAVGRIGAVLVNVNPAYRLSELEDALALADVATLIVGTPFKGSNFVAMVETLCPEVAAATSRDWSAGRFPRLKRLIALGIGPGRAGGAGPTSKRRAILRPARSPPERPLYPPATCTTSSSPRGRPVCPRARCSRTGTCS